MADAKLTVLVEGKDYLTPALKHMESGVIRFVGAVSSILASLSVIAKPITLAAEFQKQMLEVQKTTGFADNSIRSLSKGILALSKNINVSAPELAKIAALGGQLGVADRGGASSLLSFTAEIARAVTALDVSAEEAATSLGKLINIFNIDESQYGNVIAVINKISNVSTAKPEELFDIMRRMGDLGGSITVQQSAALSALAIDVGLTAETAGTSFEKIFSNMKAKAADFADFVGMSLDDWVTPLTTGKGIQSLRAYLSKLNELPEEVAAQKMIELTGGGRIFSLVNKLRQQMKLGENSKLNSLLNTAEQEMRDGTSAIMEQESVLSGLSAQWEVLKNRVSEVFVVAGSKAIPAFTNLLGVIGKSFGDASTAATFGAIMENVAKAVDYIAGVVKELGGIGPVFNIIFDIAALLYATKGIKGVTTVVAEMAVAHVASTKAMQAADAERSAAYLAAAEQTAKAMEIERLKGAQLVAQKELQIAQAEKVNASMAQQAALASRVALGTKYSVVPEQSRQSYVAGMQKVNAARLAADQAYAASTASLAARKNALLTSMESQYQLELSAIHGKGSRARKAALKEQYLSDVAIVESSHAKMQAVVEASHNKQLASAKKSAVGHKSVYMQNIAEANEAARYEATTQLKIANAYAVTAKAAQVAALVKVGASKEAILAAQAELAALVAVNGALLLQSNAMRVNAATSGAILAGWATKAGNAIKSGTLGMLGGLVAMTAGGGVLTKFKNDWVGLGKNAAEASSRTATGLAVMGKGVALVSLGVKVLGGLFNRILLIWLAIDIGAWVLNAIGQMDNFIGVLNKVIVGYNKLAKAMGLPSVDLIKTSKEQKEIANSVKETSDRYQELQGKAEAFTSAYASGLTTGGGKAAQEQFGKSLDSYSKGFDKLKKSVSDGIALNIDAPEKTTKALSDASDYLRKSGEYVQYAQAHMDHLSDSTKVYKDRLAEVTKEYDNARVKARMLTDAASKGYSVSEDPTPYLQAAEKAAKDMAYWNGRIAEANTDALRTAQVMLRVDQDRYAIFKETAKGLSQDYKAQVLDSGELKNLQESTRLYAEYKKILDGLAKPSGESRDQGREEARYYDEITAKVMHYKAATEASQKAIANTPAILAVTTGMTAAEAAKWVSSLGSVSDQYRYIDKAAKETSGGLLQVFQGLSTKAIATQEQYIAQVQKFAAYRGLSIQAKKELGIYADAADAAQKMVEKTFLKYRKMAREMGDFVEEIAATLRKQQDEAGKDTEERARDDKYEQLDYNDSLKIDALRKQLEYDKEIGRLTDAQYEKEKRAIDLKERGLKRVNEDAKAVEAATKSWTDQYASVEKTVTELDSYTVKLDLVNKKMAMAGKGEDLSPLVAEREQYLQKIEGLKAASSDLLKDLAKAPASIMGKVIGDPEKVKDMANYLATLGVEAAKLEALGAESVASFAKSSFDTQQSKMQALDIEAKRLGGTLLTFIEGSGKGIETLVRDVTVATTRLDESVTGIAEKMRTLAETDIGAFKNMDISKEIDGMIKEANTKLGAAVIDASKVKFTFTENQIYGSVLEELTKISSEKKTVDANINFDKTQVADELKDATKGLSVDVNVNANASGGATAKYASGGPVRGAGTSRSDSILSWLSHGEYVIDALTVRMFGNGFFANLKSIAKSGNVLGVLPRFAAGGPVGLGSLTPSINVLQADGIGSVVKLDISLGGRQRASVMGSRDQVANLVEALKELKRGS